MSLCRSLVSLCFTSFAAGAAFHPRGTAPYANATSITTSSASASSKSTDTHSATASKTPVQSPHFLDTGITSEHRVVAPTDAATTTSGPEKFPILANATYTLSTTTSLSKEAPLAKLGDAPFPINNTTTLTTHISNATCTINIPSASLDYWHGATYSHPVGIMTTRGLNFSNAESYTLVPYTTTFDAASALESNFVCTLSESYWAEWDYTLTMCVDYTEKPTVAATSIAYRSGYSPFPSGQVIPTMDAGLYDLYYPDYMPSATATVTLAPNTTLVETSATPFVYFTAYEIESGDKTETVHLSSARAYPYWMKGVGNESSATGPLPDGFLEQIPQSACDAGELQAYVTVLIVVDLYYQNFPMLNPFIIHVESSVLGFEDPPVIVKNLPSASNAPPITVADWNLSGTPMTASVKPNTRPNPVPTTKAHVSDHGNDAGSQKSQIPIPSQPTRITVGTIGTNPVVIGPSSEVFVGSQTLQPGGPPINVEGKTPVSLAPSATAIVVGGRTSSLPRISSAKPQARPPPILTIGSSTLTPNAATQFFITPGQTLSPGGVATVDGTVVSLAPSASFVVIGGSTQVLPDPGAGSPATRRPQIVVGGSTILAEPTQDASGNINNQNNPSRGPTFIVSGQTLAPGASAITVSGTTLSLGPSGSVLILNGATSTVAASIAPAVAPPTVTVGSEIFFPIPPSQKKLVIAGQTLSPGGKAITVSGTTLSLAPSAAFVVIDGVTSNIANPAVPSITVGNIVFSPSPASSQPTFLIGGQTLAPGGPAITVSGTTLSLARSASFVVVNGMTSTIVTAAAPITAPPLTIGDVTFRPLPGTRTAYLIGSMLLTPGGSIVISSTTISLAPGASALVVDGETSFISLQPQQIVTNPPLLTIGAETYTAVSGGSTTFIIEGRTLTPGGTITVDGTTIILASGATELIYGSSGRSTTTVLFPATTTRSQDITKTSSPTAGASGTDGHAAQTSSIPGVASHGSDKNWALLFVAVILWLMFAQA
ncbi:hypothetical protein BDW02DRAFT_592788 [Decorospora gaudefroyi]|uniref:Uncharacterized protein n=1 Tax=Decorospora gaudefroyi TaxID=184978 RepID=A0A6A5JWX1_9PLEO|nr:hypothetical protein BDW02DRAFT_592788 [Decorospora gaudefroyi]